MKKHKSYYLNFAKNIFSQNGEDGIIEKIFNDLGITGGILCEFGAWDGIWLSNIANLYLYNKNYNAILIEYDLNRANECLNLLKNFDNVEVYNCMVSPDNSNEHSIDNLLDQSSFDINEDNFSLMSIDVDSCDYYIFESIEKYKPKIIIIETDSNYLPDQYFSSYDRGTSLKSLDDLSKIKGYTLICSTGNAIFVRDDLIKNLPKKKYNIENLYVEPNYNEKYLQSVGPDGKIGDSIYYTKSEYANFIAKIKKELLEGKLK